MTEIFLKKIEKKDKKKKEDPDGKRTRNKLSDVGCMGLTVSDIFNKIKGTKHILIMKNLKLSK